MTPEEIKHTSRKFAELKGGHAVCSEKEIQKRALLLEQYTHFLMEDFCIVPKSKVKDEYDFWCQRLPKKYNLASEINNNPDTARMWGKIEVLEDIFGKDTFEEEGE